MHRRKGFSIGFAIACLSVAASSAMAQGRGQGQGQPPAPFMTHQLKPNVYWIEGGGGNSGVIVGDKGVIVIDAKTTAAGGKELLDNIAKITPKPVTTVILTHSDGDHVNGLASFPAGVKVIAQENNKKEQETALAAGGRGAPPADHLPSQVISKNKETLKIEGEKVELHHWAPAHTSGDLIVYLPSEKIVFTGDIIAGGQKADPLIHLEKNGSSEGWITTVKGIASLNADQFVEGHGDVLTKADIQKRLADAEAKRAKIKDLVSQGKSLEEIRTAVGDPPPAQGGGRGPGFPTFTQVVYQELTKKSA
jgi:cyclase